MMDPSCLNQSINQSVEQAFRRVSDYSASVQSIFTGQFPSLLRGQTRLITSPVTYLAALFLTQSQDR